MYMYLRMHITSLQSGMYFCVMHVRMYCTYVRTCVCVCTYVRTYITVTACVLLCLAQSAATKAIVEAQLIRRLSQRPTKGEMHARLPV